MTEDKKFALKVLRQFLKEKKAVGEFIFCTYKKRPFIYSMNQEYANRKIKQNGQYADLIGCYFTFHETSSEEKWRKLRKEYEEKLERLKENSVSNGRE